jgi:hypothetical protein
LSATKAAIFPPSFQGNFFVDEIITQTKIVGGQQVTSRVRVISRNSTTKVLKYYTNKLDGIYPELAVSPSASPTH